MRTTRERVQPPRIVALGLGNLLLGDDGAGVHAIRRLRGRRPRGVLAVDVGTAVLDALHLIEQADHLLVFDAMRAGGAPGTVYVLGVDGVRDEGVHYSAHELSLLSALRMVWRRPLETVILAIEPARIGFGDQLSEPVARALPKLLEAAERIIAHWRAGAPGAWETALREASPCARISPCGDPVQGSGPSRWLA